ncbi:MAG: pantoate--beta-alanine ligase [Acidobacteria bacterium]|nr:pantoate--beta-alanine ligase [Acidobacteriota bacterium]MDA1234398.1 pantoate--beta-alanine ligase [Acidobacteriota bacterium]
MTTQVVSSIEEMRTHVLLARRGGESVGLVPTMGALHKGHLELIRHAKDECGRTVVTLFVNPAQFNQPSDLDAYPRPFDADLEACSSAGVDWLFAPSAEEMYSEKPLTFVDVEGLSDGLCGPYRPGHFRAVATVCAKLFAAAPADRAYFGEKDYQQLAIIRRMVRDLNFPLEIVGVPTVREPDGLAMSSRNVRLSPAERQTAAVLYRALEAAQSSDQTASRVLVSIARHVIASEPLARVEYIEIVDRDTLAPVVTVDRECRLALAVWFGKVRLIDNIAIIPR